MHTVHICTTIIHKIHMLASSYKCIIPFLSDTCLVYVCTYVAVASYILTQCIIPFLSDTCLVYVCM